MFENKRYLRCLQDSMAIFSVDYLFTFLNINYGYCTERDRLFMKF